MYWPELGALQETVLLAPETDGPGAMETLLKSVGENDNVHSRPAAWAPLEVYASGKLIVEPFVPDPDERLRVAVCPAATSV